MTPETLALIASYFLCSEAAEVRVLERIETEACISKYQNVKLSFLKIGIDEFELMSATERAVVNQQGYAAYVAWRPANQDLVNQMEADAFSAVRSKTHPIARSGCHWAPAILPEKNLDTLE